MDYSKVDREGNPLSTVPRANQSRQAGYHAKWLESNRTKFEPTAEDIKCELQLQAYGTFEPLQWEIDNGHFKKEIKKWDGKWAPYLRREGVVNNRDGLCVVGLPGDSPSDSLSMPEARRRTGKHLSELDFNTPTSLYDDLTSLHPLLDYWNPIGRTMLVRLHAGGWFPPHKDQPQLTRETFRVVAFLGNSVSHDAYEWEMDGQKQTIKSGGVYYVDTRRTHRTHSWRDNSVHLVMNIPKTWENVLKLMSATMNF